MKNKLGKRAERAIFSILLSFIFITICSKSSFLYPMNDWLDVNCFFTVGKSLLSGKVLYLDIYEQKGPLLYFIYALFALIDRNSFIGVYLMELICFAVYIYFNSLIVGLFIEDKNKNKMICILVSLITVITEAFVHGGSVEEMNLPLMTASLYLILKAIKEERALSFKETFIIGIFTSAALWIKYTMCGFYFGLALFIIIYYAFKLKDGKALLKTIGHFFAGLIPITLICFAYFIITSDISVLFKAYFLDNLTYYQEDVGLIQKFINMVYCIYWSMKDNPLMYALIIIGVIKAVLKIKKNFYSSLVLVMSCGVLLFVTFITGKSYLYYGLPMAVFMVFGLIALAEKIPQKISINALAVSLVMVLSIVCGYCFNNSRYYIFTKKEDVVQYRFAEIMKEASDNPTLLMYGQLDYGFYFSTDVIPSTRYFCTLNIHIKEQDDEMKSYIENGVTEFVTTLEPLDFALDKYKLIATDHNWYEFQNRDYYLYQRID